MKENYFDNRIYYKANEFKEGRPTLVFVHGVSGSSSAWIPYEKIFENKYNVLTYDIRGHGNSKKYPNYADYEVVKFALDLHDLTTYLNISKFVLISNSFGGQIALAYLKLFKSTVVANIFTSPEVYVADGVIATIARPILTIVTAFLSILPFDPKPRGQVDYTKHPNSTDWDIKRNLADMKNTTLRVHFYVLRHSFNPLFQYDFDEINVPTLIIHGRDDTMVPLKNALRMSHEIKGSEFISIPEIDHNTAHNAVKVITDAITTFVDKISL